MDYEHPDGLQYTESAWELFYDLVDGPRFEDGDEELIFDTLKNRSVLIPFGTYLKRFLYEQNHLTEAPEAYSTEYYRDVIQNAFKANHTPAAFRKGNEALNDAVGKEALKWLTKPSTNRETVFLLGFGLLMSVDEVNEFLRKTLGEREINPKVPEEVICWYCYMKKRDFYKYEKLLDAFHALQPSGKPVETGAWDLTIGRRQTMYGIHDEASLMAYLAGLKSEGGTSLHSVSAKREFDLLLADTKRIIADLFNEAEEWDNAHLRHEYEDALSRDPRLTDKEKRRRLDELRNRKKHYTPDMIRDSDIQNVFCAAIPTNKQGNLVPEKRSQLREQFSAQRFSRQRIGKLIKNDTAVNRYDLITLNFFIVSQQDFSNPKSRWMRFVDSTNEILNRCLLGELFMQNPYEMFCQLCMLTSEPLGTYSDVLELAYDTEE